MIMKVCQISIGEVSTVCEAGCSRPYLVLERGNALATAAVTAPGAASFADEYGDFPFTVPLAQNVSAVP